MLKYTIIDIRKGYKRFEKTTFNDYIMGMLSVGLSKWLERYGNTEVYKILMMIPVSMKGLPSNTKELKLDNYITAIKFELPLHNNIQSAIKSAKNATGDYLNPIFGQVKSNFNKILEWMPIIFQKAAFFDFYHNIHIVFSNVPYSEVPLHFCNKEIFELGTFVNCQIEGNLTFICITYKKMMRLHIMANSELKMNPQELIDIIIDEITGEIKEYSKSD